MVSSTGSTSASMDEVSCPEAGSFESLMQQDDDKLVYYLNSIQQAFPAYENELEAADTWGHGPPKLRGFAAQESYPFRCLDLLSLLGSSRDGIDTNPAVPRRQAFKPMLFLSGIVKALHQLDCEVIFKDLVFIADEQIEI